MFLFKCFRFGGMSFNHVILNFYKSAVSFALCTFKVKFYDRFIKECISFNRFDACLLHFFVIPLEQMPPYTLILALNNVILEEGHVSSAGIVRFVKEILINSLSTERSKMLSQFRRAEETKFIVDVLYNAVLQ